MSALVVVVGVVWLALLTLALVGHNVRLSLLRQEVASLRRARPSGPAPAPAGPAPGALAAAPRHAAVLIVSETCASCSEAIGELGRLARDPLGPGAGVDLFVLSPRPGDARVRPPLRLLVDDELYRTLYQGVTPCLVVTGGDGSVTYARPVTGVDALARWLAEGTAAGRAGATLPGGGPR